ncbi:MAG TPA: response regulator [Bryobacteraceae bacterium]|nr:response regulator [Bryobacteraceae bacterium]
MEPDARQGTILVVDDVPNVRKMVCAMLAQTGYTCLEACDGAEALRVLQDTDDVQLVLTDVVMPNMDGPQLARELSRTRPNLRILFMSGYTDDELVRSLGRASSLFLPKPFTASILMERVRQALGRPWYGIEERGRLSSA